MIKCHSIAYDKEIDGLLITVEGLLSVEEFLQIIDQTITYHPSRPNIDTIFDLSGMDFSNARQDFAKDLSNRITPAMVEQRAGAHVAYVAPTSLQFGMVRMYEIFIGELTTTTKTFRSLQDAKTWIVGAKQV